MNILFSLIYLSIRFSYQSTDISLEYWSLFFLMPIGAMFFYLFSLNFGIHPIESTPLS